VLREGVCCYQGFVSGLLDLTDDLHEGKITSPKNTICYDDYDPYLVVAADKGTATFSDLANNISLNKRYWLGDAFASGGSTGYDHKKMGITARGTWISAQRHFQELGINLNNSEVTVVGVGDMSGDVFGNGMLLSRRIKLVAAFNRQYIFVDPNPSEKESYEERLRLFNLPRSNWDDYNKHLISTGGGVFSRSAKAIALSPEVKVLLGVDKDMMVPNELIRSLLKAPVDLIWNGGIGTYVKAGTEDNADVGDRNNDNVRVNGKDLRARVVCEGGNLGLTQLGRVEYELNGGKINTDFIDNSSGVDCSDHEVNIKILLDTIVVDGGMTESQRNKLLQSMTDEVAQLVLRNNIYQNKAISLAFFSVSNDVELYGRYINDLVDRGEINRKLEFLPDDKTLMKRRTEGIGLTRSELSVLLAYSKNLLKAKIKKSALVNDPYLSCYLHYAFPKPLCQKFDAELREHYLMKEIVATQISNRLVSVMGITFVYQMQDEMGASITAIVRAYVAAIKIFKLEELLSDIDALDYQVDANVQYQMSIDAIRLVRRVVRWLLRNRRDQLNIEATIAHFAERVELLRHRLPKLLLGDDKEAMEKQRDALVEKNVPTDLALRVASINPIFHALNIVEAASSHEEGLFRVAKIYFMLADRLDLFWFRGRTNLYPVDDRWSVLARAAYQGDLDWIQRELTVRVLLDTKARSIPGKINEWFTSHEEMIQRWQMILSDIRSADKKDFAILFVAIRELFDIAARATRE